MQDKTGALCYNNIKYCIALICARAARGADEHGGKDMATLLLLLIYIAFIGLGIPDSLFGSAWPAIYEEFGLPVSWANFITLLISGCTILSSLLSPLLIRKWGTGVLTAVCTSLTAIALLGFSLSQAFWWLCIFAVPLGLGAGSIDTALNNYVANHYKATHMSFLHCFYGIGVTLSPLLMSFALSGSEGWRGGYRAVFWFQLAVALLTIVALPLWAAMKKRRDAAAQLAQKGEDVPQNIERSAGNEMQNAPADATERGAEGGAEMRQARPAGLLQAVRTPSVRAAWFVFFGSCALECTCGNWGSTFLVGARGLSADAAALAITFYYVGMALGRFLSGVFANKFSPWKIIHAGQAALLAALVLLMLPLPAVVATVGLFLVGLGNGPLFPNMLHLTPINFGRELSEAAMSTEMAASYVGILAMPALFGLLAQGFSVSLFPYYLLAMYAVMMGATFVLRALLKKNAVQQ